MCVAAISDNVPAPGSHWADIGGGLRHCLAHVPGGPASGRLHPEQAVYPPLVHWGLLVRPSKPDFVCLKISTPLKAAGSRGNDASWYIKAVN